VWLGGLVRLGASLHGDPLLQCRVLGCAAPDAGVAGAEAAILADHSGRQTGVPEGVLRQISAPLASIGSRVSYDAPRIVYLRVSLRRCSEQRR
jgi:hypothetical protein